MMLILKFYSVLVCLHDVINIINQISLSCKHVDYFLPRKYDVISQLCHSYAKDPLCVSLLMNGI